MEAERGQAMETMPAFVPALLLLLAPGAPIQNLVHEELRGAVDVEVVNRHRFARRHSQGISNSPAQMPRRADFARCSARLYS